MSLPRIQPSGGTPTTQDFVSLQTQWAQQLEPLLASGDGIPIGVLWPWPTATAPTKFLLVQGQLLLISTYQQLFNAIGTTYNQSGDPAQFFRLPSAPGRVMLFVGTSTASGATAHTLGQLGGEETHTLTGSESGTPVHNHNLQNSGVGTSNSLADAGTTGSPFTGVAKGPAAGGSISIVAAAAANASSAHNTLSPYFCTNLIIKYLP